MYLLLTILKDLFSNKETVEYIKSVGEPDIFYTHFSLGAYIRNKYLWRNKENINKLAEVFENTTHPDDLSGKIVKIFITCIKNGITKF